MTEVKPKALRIVSAKTNWFEGRSNAPQTQCGHAPYERGEVVGGPTSNLPSIMLQCGHRNQICGLCSMRKKPAGTLDEPHAPFYHVVYDRRKVKKETINE